MIDNFKVYSHPIQDVPANDTRNADFLTTEAPFEIQNRVFNQWNNEERAPIAFGQVIATMTIGGNGSENYLMQNLGLDSTEWLPRYRSSERIRELYLLHKFERMNFTYENRTGAAIGGLQTSFLGKSLYPNEAPISGGPLRPYMYGTRGIHLDAVVGQSVTEQITIQGDMAFYCRAFIGRVFPGNVAVVIRNLATGYAYHNTPTLMENFVHNLDGEVNFRPLGFEPFVIPERTTLEITFTNIGGLEYNGGLTLWGNHHTPTNRF